MNLSTMRCARFGDLLGQAKRTRPEDKLMDLLGVLIMDYDRRHGMPPDDSTTAEILGFLMEHSQKTPSDLMPVFGQRSHVNSAPSRPVSSANCSASVRTCLFEAPFPALLLS
jgi:hypothetical protein